MEKAQDIPLEIIFNTINNVKTKDADDQFDDLVPLPGNSSFVPVPNEKTIKIEKTLKKKEEIEEEIEEDLEEYYDEDFQPY